ncbi:MAG TPA: ATP-binding protein [Patescibacteria group bacterium]|nr:ATP-binding protein [Patescibacteria group bacterium]
MHEETAISTVQHDTDRGEAKRQLAAVMEIANAINSKLDLDEILSTISKELSKVIDFDIGCVAIYEKDENCLYIRHITRRNGDRSTEGRYVPLDESNLVGWVAIHKKPILRRSIPTDARFNEIMKEDNLGSDIVVPLVAKDTLIGTVNVGSYEENHFTEFDLEIVTKFNQLTAIAIEKSQLLQELNELGDKYRMLMNNATDVIMLLNFSGEVIECNRSTYRHFGYSAEEILGKEFFLFVTPNRRSEAKQVVYRILQGERGQVVELPFLRKNGDIVQLETDATVMKVKGYPYVLVIGHNVTERKKLQEKITIQNRELRVNNQKLLELDQLKSEFLGRISHELRTPLSVIMAYTSTLLEDGDGAIDIGMRNEFLQIIEEQSNKLLQLINDLLDLSKVEISETMLNFTEGSINEMIRLSIRIVESFAQQNEIEIISSLDPLIPIISFDPLRIRQVCANLLNNAIKFSRHGGSVLISSSQNEREVVVSVSDTGPGIDQKDIPGIFDFFTQIDGGSSRNSDGMGIGLRLVKHYINLHRGRIWVESGKGEGSTFYFTLPKNALPEVC